MVGHGLLVGELPPSLGEEVADLRGTIGRGRPRARLGGDQDRLVVLGDHNRRNLVMACLGGDQRIGVFERLGHPGLGLAKSRCGYSWTWTRQWVRELSMRPGRFSSRVMCPSSTGLL